MKLTSLALIAVQTLFTLAQDDCSINFTIAYEIDTYSKNGMCAKSTVDVNNVNRSCLNRMGASTACMRSAFSFAYLPGSRENALRAAEKCQCGYNPGPDPDCD